MFLLAGMGPPGGGRTVISPRLQSRFNLINMTFPSVCLEQRPVPMHVSLSLSLFRQRKFAASSVQ